MRDLSVFQSSSHLLLLSSGILTENSRVHLTQFKKAFHLVQQCPRQIHRKSESIWG